VSGPDAAKEAAGRAGAACIATGMRVGLGTGSTVRHTILALGQRDLDIECVATSESTRELAESLGLRVVAPDTAGALDVAVDGADEVDPAFNLVKGGGGAHTREKVVARMAERFVVVVDGSKVVERLGDFGVPLEVLDFAPGVVRAWLEALGAESVDPREQRSDSGNLLLDARFGPILDPAGLATTLSAVPGIVEHGLFPGEMVDRVIVGAPDGSVRDLSRDPTRNTPNSM